MKRGLLIESEILYRFMMNSLPSGELFDLYQNGKIDLYITEIGIRQLETRIYWNTVKILCTNGHKYSDIKEQVVGRTRNILSMITSVAQILDDKKPPFAKYLTSMYVATEEEWVLHSYAENLHQKSSCGSIDGNKFQRIVLMNIPQDFKNESCSDVMLEYQDVQKWYEEKPRLIFTMR